MSYNHEKLLMALKHEVRGVPLYISKADAPHLIEKSGINTLLCTDSYSRTIFISNLVSLSTRKNKLVIYVDLDTMFTAYLTVLTKSFDNAENLVIFNPDESNIDSIISQICSLKIKDLDLVVFDSVTLFNHLFHSIVNFSLVNIKIGLYLKLLQSLASHSTASIIVTSLAKSKKVIRSGRTYWIPSYAGGRILERMSDLILHLERNDPYLDVNIIKSLDADIEDRLLKLSLLELTEPFCSQQK